MIPRSLQCSWTCEIDFLIQEQKLVPQELELDGLEEETPTDKEKKEKEEAENIDEAKKIVEALTKSEGESCKYTLRKNLIIVRHIGFYQDWKIARWYNHLLWFIWCSVLWKLFSCGANLFNFTEKFK